MRILLIVLLSLISLTLTISDADAYTKVGRTDKNNKSENPFRTYSAQKYNLGIHLSGGDFLDDIKDKLTDGGNFSDLHVFGAGFSAVYHVKTKYAVGLNFNLLFKYIRQTESSTYVKTYSAYFIYKLRTMRKNIPFSHFEYGYGTIKESSVRDFGKSPIMKIGIGYLYHSASSNHSRLMLYYQKLIPNDTVKEYGIPFYHFDHNLPIIGFEFVYAFSL